MNSKCRALMINIAYQHALLNNTCTCQKNVKTLPQTFTNFEQRQAEIKHCNNVDKNMFFFTCNRKTCIKKFN